jgi:Ca2+/Na+ antiporter
MPSDLGLGFPWLLRAIVYDESMPVDKDGILVTLIILFCTVILFVGVLMASGWRMTKQVGVGLFSIYCGFVTYRIIDAVG